jgi:hypothetical protein
MAARSLNRVALVVMLAEPNRRRTLRPIHRTSDLPIIMPTARGRKCHVAERLREGGARCSGGPLPCVLFSIGVAPHMRGTRQEPTATWP